MKGCRRVLTDLGPIPDSRESLLLNPSALPKDPAKTKKTGRSTSNTSLVSLLDAPISPMLGALPLGSCDGRASVPCLRRIEDGLVASVAQLGFPYLRYSQVHAAQGSGVAKRRPPTYSVNFSTFPSEWTSRYEREALFHYDPIYHELEAWREGDSLVRGTWCEIRERYLSNPPGEPSQHEVYRRRCEALFADAAQHGLRSGVYLLARGAVGRSILSLASPESDSEVQQRCRQPGFWHTLLGLSVLTNFATGYTRGCDRCRIELRGPGVGRIELSGPQVALLREYLKKPDATSKDIAKACGVSTDTVKYHLKAIRRKTNLPGASGHALASFFRSHNLI